MHTSSPFWLVYNWMAWYLVWAPSTRISSSPPTICTSWWSAPQGRASLHTRWDPSGRGSWAKGIPKSMGLNFVFMGLEIDPTPTTSTSRPGNSDKGSSCWAQRRWSKLGSGTNKIPMDVSRNTSPLFCPNSEAISLRCKLGVIKLTLTKNSSGLRCSPRSQKEDKRICFSLPSRNSSCWVLFKAGMCIGLLYSKKKKFKSKLEISLKFIQKIVRKLWMKFMNISWNTI